MAAEGPRAPSLSRSFTVGATLLLAGQAALILLGPYSRAQGTYTRQQGIVLLSPDSAVYLRSSTTLAAIGEVEWTRWTYLLVVRLGHLLGDAGTVTVLFQLFLAAAVGAALHRAIAPAAGSIGGWAAAAAFNLNPFVAQWFRFVHSETLFFAMIVIIVLVASGLILSGDPGRRRSDLVLVLTGLAAAGVRPNGSLVLLSAIGLVAWRRLERRAALGVSTALVLAAPLLLLAGLDATGQPFEGSLTSQLYSGIVVEGTDEVRVRASMPAPSDPSDESIAAAAGYVVTHPLSATRLAATRILAEVIQIRPHYPRIVNIAAGGGILVYLFAALVGMLDRTARPLRGPIAAVMLPILLLVGMTFATPEARYGWGALIALAPAVGIGVGRLRPRTN